MTPPRVIVFGGPGGRGGPGGSGPGGPGGPGPGGRYPPGSRRPRFLRYALAAALLLALVEIVVLIALGQSLGVGWTIGLLLALSLAGAWLVRKEGRRSWRALREATRSGAMPAKEVTDAVLVLVGGLLLLLPGFVTDVVGLLLVLPFTRPLGRAWLHAVVTRRVLGAFPDAAGEHATGGRYPGTGPWPPGGAGDRSGNTPGADEVIEGEVIDDDDQGRTGT